MKYDFLIAGSTSLTIITAATLWLIIFSYFVADTVGYNSLVGLFLYILLMAGAIIGGFASSQHVIRNQLLSALEAVMVAITFGLLMVLAVGYCLSHYANNKYPTTKVIPDENTCTVGLTATACPSILRNDSPTVRR